MIGKVPRRERRRGGALSAGRGLPELSERGGGGQQGCGTAQQA